MAGKIACSFMSFQPYYIMTLGPSCTLRELFIDIRMSYVLCKPLLSEKLGCQS